MILWRHRFSQNSNEIIVKISALYNGAEIFTILTLLFWLKPCLHKIISVFTDLYSLKYGRAKDTEHFIWTIKKNVFVEKTQYNRYFQEILWLQIYVSDKTRFSNLFFSVSIYIFRFHWGYIRGLSDCLILVKNCVQLLNW